MTVLSHTADLRFSFGWFKIARRENGETMKPPTQRRRITVSTSVEGVERARSALARLGFESLSQFAKAQLMGKSTVDKFFNRQPIQLSSFTKDL